MNWLEPKRILILGGGFGGLYAALHLDRTLAREPGVEVTLVNRDNFFLFTPMLHEVVAGGGFAGVETLASIHDFVHDALRFYPRLQPHMIRMVLVHSGDAILPELGEKLGAYAGKKLAERGIEIRVNTRVTDYTDGSVGLNDGTRIQTDTLIWTAGTSPNPLLETLPCPKERGRLVVDATLGVSGHPGVWALGDCALVPDRRTGRPHPPTAQHALREGKVVAHNASRCGRNTRVVATGAGNHISTRYRTARPRER